MCHKYHSTGKRKKKKKKKKKKKRTSGETTTESESEFVSKQGDIHYGKNFSLKRQEELPDIIPKQVTKKSLEKFCNCCCCCSHTVLSGNAKNTKSEETMQVKVKFSDADN